MNYLFIDTETSDFRRPHLVELAWMLADFKGEEIESYVSLVKPTDWKISPEALDCHGITTEVAATDGLPLKEVLEELAYIITEAGLMVGHGIQYDTRVLAKEFDDSGVLSDLNNIDRFCTMRGSTEFCKIPKKKGGFKWPKLAELYYILFEKDLLDAHGALVDVQTVSKCFFELKRRGVIKL